MTGAVAGRNPSVLSLALAAPAPAHGWVSRWTTAAGHRIHERSRPHAPATLPVVLLHGLAVSHRYLMPTAHALRDRHPAVVPDLPGFGLSDKPRAAYDVGEHADVLAAWLAVRGLHRVCLVGHSFGAEVAVRLAVTRPGVVAALVLASPTADPSARTRRSLVGRWLADLPLEDPRQAMIIGRDAVDARWRIFRTIARSVHNAVEEDLVQVSAPTLVLGGSLDPVAPARWRHEAARLAGGTAVTLPDAAHNVLTTAGVRSAAAISRHVAGLPG